MTSSDDARGGGAEERLNLGRLTVLLVEPNTAEQDLLAQMLHGFGARSIHRCSNTTDARQALAIYDIGLIVLDGSTPDGQACEFVVWLRREAPEPRRYLPVLMLSGHVRASQVFRARDCGANFIIAKPLAPRVLLDRIAWMGRETRGFLAVDGGYVGPDRRFRSAGPPDGLGRRREDAAIDVAGREPTAAELASGAASPALPD